MATGIRGSSSVTTPGAGSTNAQISVSVPKPSGVVAGDFLVVFVLCDTDATLSFLTAPSGWSLSGSAHSFTGVAQCKVFVKTAGASEPSTYSFGADDFSSGVYICVAVSGADTTTPVNVAPTWTDTSASTNHVAPSISPTVANAMMLSAWTSGNNTTYTVTVPASMTQAQNVWSGSYERGTAAYQQLSATGTTGTRVATCSIALDAVGVSMAIAPLVAAPSTPPGAFLEFFS